MKRIVLPALAILAMTSLSCCTPEYDSSLYASLEQMGCTWKGAECKLVMTDVVDDEGVEVVGWMISKPDTPNATGSEASMHARDRFAEYGCGLDPVCDIWIVRGTSHIRVQRGYENSLRIELELDPNPKVDVTD